jgi:hypothetical protein
MSKEEEENKIISESSYKQFSSWFVIFVVVMYKNVYIFVSMCTSNFSFPNIVVNLPLTTSCLSPLFSFNVKG